MNQLQVHQTPAPMRPRDYNSSQLQLIKRTIAKDTSEDEFNLFVEISKRVGLDPFRKQIYAFVFNKDDAAKRQFVTVTGIDGYRAVAKRTGEYRPSDSEPEIDYDETLKDPESNPLGIIKAKVIVYQYGPDKQWYPVVGVAHWKEFAPMFEEGTWEPIIGANGQPVLETEGRWAGKPKKRKVGTGKFKLTKENWKTMPIVMISKCAEAQALRKAWPEELSGVYVAEEIDRTEADQTASEMIESYEEEQRLMAVNGRDSYPLIMENTKGIEMIHSGKIADRVLEKVNSFETWTEIEAWKEQNRVGLQQYWAREKSDALELKKQIETIAEQKPRFKDHQGVQA